MLYEVITRLVHQRAALLGADRAVEQGSLDRYGYIRDFYLQRRRYEIYDGHPPRERFDDGAWLEEDANSRALAHVEADVIAVTSMKLALVRPASSGRVITSYSIHYTKLYEHVDPAGEPTGVGGDAAAGRRTEQFRPTVARRAHAEIQVLGDLVRGERIEPEVVRA